MAAEDDDGLEPEVSHLGIGTPPGPRIVREVLHDRARPVAHDAGAAVVAVVAVGSPGGGGTLLGAI